MRSPATCRTADPAVATEIAALDNALWAEGFSEARLPDYQAAFRRMEERIAAGGADNRHKFVIVIPVADRPQHLAACLDSVLGLCRTFHYGGLENGRWRKVAVVIADDSDEPQHITGNRELARKFNALGLPTDHFGPDEQVALQASLSNTERTALAGVLGDIGPGYRGHKGQGVMRNLAYLHLARMQAAEPDEKLLFYSIDSDQEFKVKVGAAAGDRDVFAVSFFHCLDAIFAGSEALVLTGKVVGDPPVSPAVMAGNFLEDVIAFLDSSADGQPRAACCHHARDAQREGEAAYHDMAHLFGFPPASTAYRYLCPLSEPHTEADCFRHFSERLNGFFYGEHPTRVSRYLHDDLWRTVQPARTVYAGNYIFRAEGLNYFIPFAPRRLRMSGPTLGRLIKAEIGPRFVSANLPMLHKRTVDGTSQSEFRPGVSGSRAGIDLCGEFERQFFGDVMLFSIERLTSDGFPGRPAADKRILDTLEIVRADLLRQYNDRRAAIVVRLGRLRSLLDDPAQWWNRDPAHGIAVDHFQGFATNIARNFGDDSSCRERINSAANWLKWRADLQAAIVRYPDDARAWAAALARHA